MASPAGVTLLKLAEPVLIQMGLISVEEHVTHQPHSGNVTACDKEPECGLHWTKSSDHLPTVSLLEAPATRSPGGWGSRPGLLFPKEFCCGPSAASTFYKTTQEERGGPRDTSEDPPAVPEEVCLPFLHLRLGTVGPGTSSL